MKVYDPFAKHEITYEDQASAHLLECAADHVALQSETGDWFAVYVPSGRTVMLDEIDGAVDEVEAIDFRRAFLAACAEAEEIASYHPRYRLLEERAGHAVRLPKAVKAAEEAARNAGYDDSIIELAYSCLDQ